MLEGEEVRFAAQIAEGGGPEGTGDCGRGGLAVAVPIPGARGWCLV